MLHILICWMPLRWYSDFTSNNIGDIAHDQTWGHALDLRQHIFFGPTQKTPWCNATEFETQAQYKCGFNLARSPKSQSGCVISTSRCETFNHRSKSGLKLNQKNHQFWPGFSEKTPQNIPKSLSGSSWAYHLLAIRSGSILHCWRNPTVRRCPAAPWNLTFFAGLFWTPTHGKTWNWKTRKYEVKNS